MGLNNGQFLTIIGTILLFFILYFGCETKPTEILEVEKSMAFQLEATGFDNLIRDAVKRLSKEDLVLFNSYRKEVNDITIEDTIKVKSFEQLSSFWYEQSDAALSGYYAEEIAKI